jgi:hypothetical protein
MKKQGGLILCPSRETNISVCGTGVSASAMWSPWIIFRDGPLYFAASAPDLAT